jgi:hypothetical protein
VSAPKLLGVIGSAGRGNDAARIDRALYDAMYAETLAAMSDFGTRDLVSGGAALADHLAVRAFVEGEASSLTLFLPAAFSNGRYEERRGDRNDPGATTNRYHAGFSRSCGVDGLGEIAEAIRKGAHVEVHRGFKNRNLEVAAASTYLLALTFGSAAAPEDIGPDDAGFGDFALAGLKDGGTAHTWGQAWKCDRKRHVSLTWLETRPDRVASPPRTLP